MAADDAGSSFLKLLVSEDEQSLAPDKLDQIKSIAGQFQIGSGQLLLAGATSGTTITAAFLIGKYTRRNLYRVDLSMVVSKFIGETEKNLSEVFEAGQKLDAILFFDEADSLFGKRSEVSDSADRFANLDTGYLLERLEAYPGLSILTSLSRADQNADWLKRMTWVIDFSKPVVVPRLSLWQRFMRWLGIGA